MRSKAVAVESETSLTDSLLRKPGHTRPGLFISFVLGSAFNKRQHVACSLNCHPVGRHSGSGRNICRHFANQFVRFSGRVSQKCDDNVLQGDQADANVAFFDVTDFAGNSVRLIGI